jgi:RNase P protein component
MLAKKRRIEKKLFSVSFQNSRRFVSPHLLLTLSKNENKPSRFSFSISKKLKNVPNGFLFFFSFKKGVYPVSFSDLEKEIVGLLQNAN